MPQALIDDLNEQQRHIVFAPNTSDILVIAGAGTGKTRVLVSRIAYLIETENIKPHQIMAMTFTNKAAQEMKERICKFYNWQDLHGMWVNTFHSMCYRILSQYHLDAKLPSNFSVLTEDDQAQIIRGFQHEFDIKARDKDYGPLSDRKLDAKSVIKRINKEKEQNIAPIFDDLTVDQYLKNLKNNWRTLDEEDLYQIFYAIYHRICRQAAALDFYDLLSFTKKLLSTSDNVKQQLHQRFKAILIDEFQDTNSIQYDLIMLLKSANCHIFVVGDDDQAIYGWRGANYKNLSRLNHDLKNLTTFELSINYRSNQNILNFANSLIAHNQERLIDKQLLNPQYYTQQQQRDTQYLIEHNIISAQDAQNIDFAHLKALFDQAVKEHKIPPTTLEKRHQLNNERTSGNIVTILKIDRDNVVEGLAVYTLINLMHNKHGLAYQDIAVLYRKNSLSSSIENVLNDAHIPYQIYGGFKFYERAEILSAIAYLRLILNPKDDVAFLRVINEPKRSIGPSTLNKFKDFARECGLSLYETLGYIINNVHIQAMKSYKRLLPFYDLIEDLKKQVHNYDLGDFISYMYQTTGLLSYYAEIDAHKKEQTSSQNKADNLTQLVTNARNFIEMNTISAHEFFNHNIDLKNLSRYELFAYFVTNVSLSSSSESNAQGQYTNQNTDKGVQLMTIHASKGLEFKGVIVVGCEDGIMPSALHDDTEEERRLAYVAFTRAKEHLFITCAQSRMDYDGTIRIMQPSPFIYEAISQSKMLANKLRPYTVARFDSSRYGY